MKHGIPDQQSGEKHMQNGSGYDRSNVLTLSFAHLLHDIYSSFLAPLLPLLMEKLAFTYAMAGMLSMFSRLPSLLNPLIGLVSDRMALRYFVIAAPAVTCVTMSFIGLASSYTALAALLFVMGISAALFHVPGPVLIRRVSGDRIGKGMSFYMLGGEFARTLGPLAILGAVSLWGLEGTWRLIVPGLGASLFFYFKLRNIDGHGSAVQKKKTSGVRSTFMQYLPLMSVLGGITASRSLMKAALTIFLPVYMTSIGQSVWFSGISLSVLEFAGAFGTLYFGSVSDKIGRRPALTAISAATPFFIFALVFIDGVFIIPILLATGFLLLAPTPIMLAVVQEVAKDRPAFLNGIFMTMNFIIGALAAILVGVMADHLGLQLTFVIAGFAAFGAIPFARFVPKRGRV